MSVFTRQLLLSVIFAGLAGFGGVWFGAHGLQSEPTAHAPPLRLAVDELTRRGMVGLTDAQKQRITDIQLRYARKRTQLRVRIAAANVELADALAVEMNLGPKVDHSIEDLKGVIGELQRETVAYVLELRSVLSAQQQMVFDEKVVAALMTPPG